MLLSKCKLVPSLKHLASISALLQNGSRMRNRNIGSASYLSPCLLFLQRAGYEVYGMQAPEINPEVCKTGLPCLKGIKPQDVNDI